MISQGALFLWVILPETLDATQLLTEAVADKVAFVLWASFFADGSGHDTLRLNFSNAAPAHIGEDIRRLGTEVEFRAEDLSAVQGVARTEVVDVMTHR